MWLINTTTLRLHNYQGFPPDYVILSHTWGAEEVSFEDMQGKPRAIRKKEGYRKIWGCCEQALRDGFEWAWVDTCCIDKRSSAELSEAINTMYQWYWKAAICYVYLSDVHVQDPYERFKSSRWFTRGWTLQELLAPAVVEFYDAAWNSLGSKSRNVERIKAATQIHGKYIENRETIQEASISTKFSWASSRETTRVEDAAYCILGLVQVNMPMLYGEGKRAFYRLQLELLRKKHDHTIFTWSAERGQVSGVLAPSLSYFSDSDNYSVTQMSSTDDMLTHDVTNNGLRITLLCRPCGADGLLGRLNCVDGLDRTVAIELRPSSDGHHYQRRKVHALYGWGDQSGSESHGWTPRSLYLNIDEDYSIETDSRVHRVAIADIRPKYDYNINGVSVSDHQKVDIVRRRYNEENPLNADVAHKQRLFVLQQLYCSEDLTACVRIGSALWTPTYQAIIFGLHHERPMIHHTIDAGGAVKKNWFVELHANPSRYVRDHARFTNDEYVVEVKAKKTRGTNGLSWTLEVKAFECVCGASLQNSLCSCDVHERLPEELLPSPKHLYPGVWRRLHQKLHSKQSGTLRSIEDNNTRSHFAECTCYYCEGESKVEVRLFHYIECNCLDCQKESKIMVGAPHLVECVCQDCQRVGGMIEVQPQFCDDVFCKTCVVGKRLDAVMKVKQEQEEEVAREQYLVFVRAWSTEHDRSQADFLKHSLLLQEAMQEPE